MFILFHVIFSIHLNAISSVDQGDRFVYRKKVNQTWTRELLKLAGLFVPFRSNEGLKQHLIPGAQKLKFMLDVQ